LNSQALYSGHCLQHLYYLRFGNCNLNPFWFLSSLSVVLLLEQRGMPPRKRGDSESSSGSSVQSEECHTLIELAAKIRNLEAEYFRIQDLLSRRRNPLEKAELEFQITGLKLNLDLAKRQKEALSRTLRSERIRKRGRCFMRFVSQVD
jgi:hypothetical protein